MLRDDDRSPGTLLPTYLRQVNSRQDPITQASLADPRGSFSVSGRRTVDCYPFCTASSTPAGRDVPARKSGAAESGDDFGSDG
jgi:hypothetical protein